MTPHNYKSCMISKLGQPLEIIICLFKMAFTYMITVSYMSFQQLSKGDGKDVNNSKEYGGPEWMWDLPTFTYKMEPGPCTPCSLHPLFHFYLTSMSPPSISLKHFRIWVTVSFPSLCPSFSITESSMLMTTKFLNSSHFQLHHTLATSCIFSSPLRYPFGSTFLTQSPHFRLLSLSPYIYSICPLP